MRRALFVFLLALLPSEGRAACPGDMPGRCRGFSRTRLLALEGVLGNRVDASPIRAVGFDERRRRAVGLREDGALIVWDLRTGAVHVARTAKHIALSPDGRFAVATVPRKGEEGDWRIRGQGVEVWDLGQGRRTARLKLVWEEYLSITYAAGLVMTGLVIQPPYLDYDPSGVLVWRPGAARIDDIHFDRPVGLAVPTPDGRRAVVVDASGHSAVWDLEGRRVRCELAKWRREMAVGVSGAGRAAIYLPSEGVRVVNLETCAETARYGALGSDSIRGLSFSPDGRKLAAIRSDGAVDVVDVALERQAVLQVAGASLTSVAFSDDGTIALSGDDEGNLRLWDARMGGALRAARQDVGHEAAITSLSTSRDGRLVSGSMDGTLRVWDLASGRLRRTVAVNREVELAAISADGGMAVVRSSGGDDLVLWDVELGVRLRALTPSRGGATTLATAISPDGALALQVGNSDARLWELPSGRERWVRRVEGFGAAFSPDQNVALVALAPGGFEALAIESGDTLGSHPAKGEVSAIAFDPRGRFVIGAGYDWQGVDQPLARWSLPGFVPGWTVSARQELRSVAISPDGRIVAAAGPPALTRRNDDDLLERWPARLELRDTATGRTIDTLDFSSSGDEPTTVTFTPDGRSLLVGMGSGLILRYRVTR